MSTYNHVSVTVAADSDPDNSAYAEGNVVAIPSGTEWPDTSSNPIVPPIVRGQLLNGTCTISLVASDNFTAGVLTWDFIINIRGLATINVAGCAVNFSNGASQNVWTILSNAGWSPPTQP
jgi:hypothetical protein